MTLRGRRMSTAPKTGKVVAGRVVTATGPRWLRVKFNYFIGQWTLDAGWELLDNANRVAAAVKGAGGARPARRQTCQPHRRFLVATPFPGLGARVAVALEAAGIDTVDKLSAVIRDDNLMAVPGVNTFDQAETIKSWLKMNRRAP